LIEIVEKLEGDLKLLKKKN